MPECPYCAEAGYDCPFCVCATRNHTLTEHNDPWRAVVLTSIAAAFILLVFFLWPSNVYQPGIAATLVVLVIGIVRYALYFEQLGHLPIFNGDTVEPLPEILPEDKWRPLVLFGLFVSIFITFIAMWPPIDWAQTTIGVMGFAILFIRLAWYSSEKA